MSLNFPPSPSPGDTFTAQGVTFVWTGSVWVVPPGGLIFASQPEAQAGERLDRAMTPLRGAQAIAAIDMPPPPVTPPEAVCIAICAFNGVSGQVFFEKNIASIAGAGTGRYTLTFRNPPPDDSYLVFGTAMGITNHNMVEVAQDGPASTAQQAIVQVGTTGGNLVTQNGFLVASALVHVGIFR
jgi:hypothetical protein